MTRTAATHFQAGSPQMITTVIVSVLAATALLAWTMWRAWKSIERSEKDPAYHRRRLFRWGTIYACAALFVIVEVGTGKEPIQALSGLPIGLLLVWWYFRAAARVKIPPN